jgi:L-amino acid N-acyltransferase YncA
VPTVRDSVEDDITAIGTIYRHHVAHGVASFELDPPSDAEMAARRAAALERGLPYVVAELDGRIGGFGYLAPYRPRPAYRYTVEDSVYVDQALLGRGIGRALLGTLIERAEALRLRQMIAVVGTDRGADAREANPSIRLHRSLSFRDVGVIEGAGFKFGRWLDTAILQRALGFGTSRLP